MNGLMRGVARIIAVLIVPVAGADAQVFDVAEIFIEQEAGEVDAEIVIRIDAGDLTLTELSVTGPTGAEIFEIETEDDEAPAGLREFEFEALVRRPLGDAYPAGAYIVEAEVDDGQAITAEMTLSHVMASAPEITVELRADALLLSWDSTGDPDTFAVEVEHETLDVVFWALVSATSLAVPRDFLAAPGEYEVEVARRNRDGNLIVSETVVTVP